MYILFNLYLLYVFLGVEINPGKFGDHFHFEEFRINTFLPYHAMLSSLSVSYHVMGEDNIAFF